MVDVGEKLLFLSGCFLDPGPEVKLVGVDIVVMVERFIQRIVGGKMVVSGG